jgi:hypothetical protein
MFALVAVGPGEYVHVSDALAPSTPDHATQNEQPVLKYRVFLPMVGNDFQQQSTTIPPPPANIRFAFSPTLSNEEQALAKAAIMSAHEFFAKELGKTNEDVLTLIIDPVRCGNILAEARVGYICIDQKQWLSLRPGKSEQIKIIAHEYYHMLDISLGCLREG